MPKRLRLFCGCGNKGKLPDEAFFRFADRGGGFHRLIESLETHPFPCVELQAAAYGQFAKQTSTGRALLAGSHADYFTKRLVREMAFPAWAATKVVTGGKPCFPVAC